MEKGGCVWLCNTTKKIDGKPQLVSCHLKYHSEKKKRKLPVVLNVA